MMLKWKGEGKILPPAKDGDAGYDICSIEAGIIEPMSQRVFKTGVHLEIPLGFVGIIKEKSGLACVEGIGAGAGVIDCGYRGEVVVLLRNFNYEEQVLIEEGQKIAQIVFIRHEHFELEHVDELSNTDRGVNGFGSTGKK